MQSLVVGEMIQSEAFPLDTQSALPHNHFAFTLLFLSGLLLLAGINTQYQAAHALGGAVYFLPREEPLSR